MYIIYILRLLLMSYTYNYLISMKPVWFDEPYYNIIKSRVRAIRVDYNNIKILRSVSLTQQVYYYILRCAAVSELGRQLESRSMVFI